MTKTAWKDATSYSRGEPTPRVPRVYRMTLGNLDIVIVMGHLHAPDCWSLTCEPFFRIKRIAAIGDPVECVKTRALTLVAAEIDTIRADLERAL